MCLQAFRRIFNSQQLLLEVFFDIISSFGSTQPESESTFPFSTLQYLKHDNLWSPQLHSSQKKTYASTGFFVGNLILNNFYLNHFLIYSALFAGFDLKNVLSHSFTPTTRIENGVCQYLGFLLLQFGFCIRRTIFGLFFY